MNLFLAHTPMQLMNAIILARTVFSEENSDLYYTDNLSAQVSRLKQENIFQTTSLIKIKQHIPNADSIYSKMVARVRNTFDLERIRQDLPTNPERYSRVFLSGINLRNIEFYYAIKSVNKQVRLSVYEEGVCEYYYMARKNYGKILFSKCFFHRFFLEDADSLYVHSPELVSLAWDNIVIKKIPSLLSNPELLQILNKVMGYDSGMLTGCQGKIVMLEQVLETEEEERQQRLILEKVCQLVGTENVAIKLHPRSPANKYGDKYNYLRIACPFELVVINEPVEDITFMSFGSSSVVNFKLMLEKEPNVILLNDVFGKKKEKTTEFDKLLYRVQAIWRKDRFFMPDSMEQLTADINHWKHNR